MTGHAEGPLRQLVDAIAQALAETADDADREGYERRTVEERKRNEQECLEGEPWRWLGDGHDDLDSMSDGMLVRISAGQLRAFRRRVARQTLDAEQFREMPQEKSE